MSVPFPEGPYEIVNYANGTIDTSGPGPVIPVVANPSSSAIFVVTNYKPHPAEHLGHEVHHLVNIVKGGQPANLKLAGVSGDVEPSDKGVVAIFNSAVPNVWCIHPADEKGINKYLVYFSRYGSIDHGEFHWHLEGSEQGTPVTVNTDQEHPINKALHAHVKAGRGASLSDLTQKLEALSNHHPDCFWKFNKCK